MELRIFTDDGMFLPCHIFKNVYYYDYYKNNKKVKKTSQIKNQVRQMIKIEKLSQKWLFVRQDEDYLYYEDKGTKYKFNKVYWRK